MAARVAADQLSSFTAEQAPDPLVPEIDWSGPVLRELPDESAVQAACGIMHVHGRAAGHPQRLGVDYASTLAGLLGAQGVLAASIARVRGARIAGVRTSVAQAALLAVQQYLSVATSDDDWAEQWPVGARPPFTSRDGVRFELETLHAEGWSRFWHELGADRAAVAAGWWPFQQRFATATGALPPALHETARSVDYGTIAAAAACSGASALAVRDSPVPPADVPACAFRELPAASNPCSVGTANEPLSGILVVESTRRIQGPLVGHVLQRLGAQVVRIEPPGGDPMRGMPPMAGDCSARFRALNDGKDVVELDLKTPAGRSAIRELVSGADAFVHNWAPGKAEEFGLDAESLARVRPGLVHAWSSGWAPMHWPDQPLGTDFLVQAHSGLAAANYPAEQPPAPSLMTLTDILGGMVCAQGVLAALLGRVRTGRGYQVDSSLFSAACVVPRPAQRQVWTELDRPLRTADGYLVLPRAFDPESLVAAAGTADPPAVAAQVREHPTAHWQERLAEAGITATPVCADLRELSRDPAFAKALTDDAFTAPSQPWEFS